MGAAGWARAQMFLTNGRLKGRLEAHGNQARWPLPPLPDTVVFRQQIMRERFAGSGRVGAAVQPPLMPHDTQEVHGCVRSWAASTWVSALAALARGRRTCARALSARVWAWARAATKHGAANTAGWARRLTFIEAVVGLGRVQAGFAAGKTHQTNLCYTPNIGTFRNPSHYAPPHPPVLRRHTLRGPSPGRHPRSAPTAKPPRDV